MNNKEYQDYIKKSSPKTKELKTLIPAFLVGGLICCIGEAISMAYAAIFPELSKTDLGSATSATLIFLGSLLTAIGVYDKIGAVSGGGSIIPITGFANSIVSPAMEYNREGIFYGICAKMFTIAGPIIVFGIAASVIVGIVGLWL